MSSAPMPPLNERLDVVLHAGMRKTGTSSIQFFLRDNREQLADLGVVFPSTPGLARHARLGLFTKTEGELAESIEWYRTSYSDPRKFRQNFRRRLVKELSVSEHNLAVFSDEILFEASRPALQRLKRLTDRIARRVRILIYLRRQDDHLVSQYQQEVKVGLGDRLTDWAQRDMARLYNYRRRLGMISRLAAPDEVVVRRFERDRFADGSLLQDFLDAAQIDARADELTQVADVNTSLDAESVEMLRLLNLYRIEHEGAVPGLIDNRSFFALLNEVQSGPILTLPGPFLDDFMSRWEEPNRAVARDYLGDPSGELFRSPRKSTNTTTEQRLDPARLDHFFALLDLPEESHAELRRLAEREAASTG